MPTLNILLLVSILCSIDQSEAAPIPSTEKRNIVLFGDHSTKLMLERIIIPSVKFEKIELAEALKFTRSIVKDYLQQTHEANLDVPFVVQAKEFEKTPISIIQRNMTVLQLIERIAKDANMTYEISEGKIVFQINGPGAVPDK